MTESEEILDLLLNADLEEKIGTMGPVEVAVKIRRAFEVISRNPDDFPELSLEHVQGVLDSVERLEICNRECARITAELAFVEAKRDAVIDSMLIDPELNKTVH